MARQRNPYRPGTTSYAGVRAAILRRKAALAQANAARTITPETRRRAQQGASAARRALHAIETRQEFRSKLDERERGVFDRLSLTRQDLLMKVNRDFPESVPRDLPDPFTGLQREVLWRLSYATRAGIRLHARA